MDALLARAPARATGRVHTLRGPLSYRAVAEFLPARTEAPDSPRGEPEAAVFTVTYLKDETPARDLPNDPAPVPPRPVCFAFNGGPGSASLWLHLGALGPKRVVVPDDAGMPVPPYGVSDNPLTWLQHMDLVFIDPPHTGWSVSAGTEARKKLLSVDGDVAALADVMHGWLTRHRRFGSPLYLAGESYGTTRGAALADKLQDAGIALSGVILVSCAMDLQSIVFAPRNDLPHALFLPAMAATAQYHGKLKGALGATGAAARAAAEAYAGSDYLTALHAGARLTTPARSRVARRLAELTGLPRAFIEQSNLRITDQAFFTELLRDEGRVVGRLESRSTGPMGAHRSREFDFDPGIEAIAAPYTMATLAYLADTFDLQLPARYEVLSMEVNRQWDWGRRDAQGLARNAFTCTSAELSRAMRRNPHLRVLAASGRYDLGTPYSASDWSLAQLDIPPAVRARVTHRYYDAGHMMYTRQADLQQLEADLAEWLTP